MSKPLSVPENKGRLKEQIDSNLRRVYDSALQEEIPDRFRDLLDQLRASQPAAADANAQPQTQPQAQPQVQAPGNGEI